MKRISLLSLPVASLLSTLLACMIGALTNPIWVPFGLSSTREIIRKYSMFDFRINTIGITPFSALAAVLLIIVLLLQVIHFRQKSRKGFWMVTAILYGLSMVLLFVPCIIWGVPRWNGWLIVLCVLLVFGFLSHLLQARSQNSQEVART